MPIQGLNGSRAEYIRIVAEECAKLRIDPALVFRRSRRREAVIARLRAWRSMRDKGCSLPGIGKACFPKPFDHSTVLSGLRRLPALEAWLAAQPREPESPPAQGPILATRLINPWRSQTLAWDRPW